MLGPLDSRIPDLIEPIIGWRSWKLATGPLGTPVFASPQQHSRWIGGALSWDMTCRCPSAGDACACGINTYKSRRQLMGSIYSLGDGGIGSVKLTGEVREFRSGWRAQHAQIDQVWATTRSCRVRVEEAAKAAGVTYMGVLPWRHRLSASPASIIGFLAVLPLLGFSTALSLQRDWHVASLVLLALFGALCIGRGLNARRTQPAAWFLSIYYFVLGVYVPVTFGYETLKTMLD